MSREGRRPFVIGAFGLVPVLLLAMVIEVGMRALGDDGRVDGVFFTAAAALTPVLALGLLVQLVTALTRRTRDLMREVQRFDQEMSAEPPVLSDESQQSRVTTWERTSLFKRAIVPFGAGVALQVVVTELVAISCVAAGTGERALALALGGEILALFGYLLFFNVLLALAASPPKRFADSPNLP